MSVEKFNRLAIPIEYWNGFIVYFKNRDDYIIRRISSFKYSLVLFYDVFYVVNDNITYCVYIFYKLMCNIYEEKCGELYSAYRRETFKYVTEFIPTLPSNRRMICTSHPSLTIRSSNFRDPTVILLLYIYFLWRAAIYLE